MMWRPAAGALLAWLGLCCLAPLSARAARELHWDRLAVTAHLNADGTLQVTETQTVVFTGDWNGGERRFDLRPGQRVSLTGISRGGPEGWQPLTQDPRLNDVDQYFWSDPTTLRWRSRRASDPPFAGTTIRYELRYVLSGILLKEDDGYRLDNDFAFPDRDGRIEQFELRLTLAPGWQPLTPVRPLYTAEQLAPGRKFVLNLPLRYTGTMVPIALDLSRPPELVMGVSAILGVTLLAVLWLFVREQRYGRFAPLAEGMDEAWLREHILKYPAEVVAAAWDENVGTAEVVTLIARMVSDGTLESVVETGPHASMTLRLTADRSTLQGHERTLIDKLFFEGRTETSTRLVRAHYYEEGFNPVTAIRPELETAVESMLPAGNSPRRFGAIGVLLFFLGIGVVLRHLSQGRLWLVLVMLGLALTGWVAGQQFRAHLEWGRRAALLCLIPPLTIAIGVTAYLWFYAGSGAVVFQPIEVHGIVTMALACIHSSVNALKSRRHRQAIAFRKALTAGRAFFVEELEKDRPALRDEWYPYLLAFELGKQVDAWTTQRAGTNPGWGSAARDSSPSIPSSEPASSSGGAWTGFGGGRSGGAGAVGSWQAAAVGMAASVAPPSSSGSSGGSGSSSSSSSSGGSSSGGSSGGGGGGGW